MTNAVLVPCSARHAATILRFALKSSPTDQTKQGFVAAWCAIAYLFPGLHPDSFDDAESGWPRPLKGFAVEAWKRYDSGELLDEELYPSDAQWAGVYDRMLIHQSEETERRVKLAAVYGLQSCA